MASYIKKLIEGSSFIFIIGILAAFIAFLTRIVLTRNLSLEEYGLFCAVFVFVSFFSFLRNLGLGASLIKYIPEFRVKERFDLIKSVIIITSSLRIFISLVFAIAFFLLSDFLAIHYFHNPLASQLLKILSVFFLLSALIDITRNLFEAFQKPFWFPFVDFSKNLFVLGFILLFFYFGLGVLSPVLAYLAMVFMLPLIFLPVILRSFKFSKYKLVLSKELVKKFFIFGMPFVFVSISAIVIAQVDTLLLTYFRSLEEVGIYNVVLPFSLLLLQFSSAISVILFPMCSEFWAKGQKERLINAVNFIYRYSFMVVIPLGLLIFYFTPSLLRIFFGEDYLPGSSAMRILLVGVMLYSIANINQYVIAGIGKPKIVAKIVGLSALFNLLGNLVLIPIYGIIGAAIMTSLSYILSLVLSLIYLKRLIGLKISIKLWAKILFSGLLMLLIIFGLNKLLILPIWPKLIVFSLVALICYLIFLLRLKLVSIEGIKSIFQRK